MNKISDKINISWKHCLLMRNAVRGFKGAADDSSPSSLFSEAMSALFSGQQVVDLIFSDVQEEQDNNYLEKGEVS